MKNVISVWALSLIAATATAQESADSMYISLSKGRVSKYSVSEIYSMGFTPIAAPEFPAADNSISLVASPGWDGNKTQLAKNVYELLSRADIEGGGDMGNVEITSEQYDEIKAFTDNLVKGLTTQKAIYDKCFNWIVSNIKYNNRYADGSVVDNNAYPVFTTKTGICQGYANLLFVMLHGQGVPVIVVGGFIPEGGHAWNYVNCDGTWYVSDPTNNRYRLMSEYTSYASTFMPTSLDAVLFKTDKFWLDYSESRLNVCRIQGDEPVCIVPYSIEGVKISLLNPTYVSPSVKELYVGKNIESFADIASGFIVGLRVNAPGLEYIHVDPDNKNFKSHEGVVYDKTNSSILIVPAAMKSLKLLPVEKLEKGAIEDVNGIEEIHFAEGTKSIEIYAISDCRNLKVAYIPESTEVANGAFYNVHKDFKIVRY